MSVSRSFRLVTMGNLVFLCRRRSHNNPFGTPSRVGRHVVLTHEAVGQGASLAGATLVPAGAATGLYPASETSTHRQSREDRQGASAKSSRTPSQDPTV